MEEENQQNYLTCSAYLSLSYRIHIDALIDAQESKHLNEELFRQHAVTTSREALKRAAIHCERMIGHTPFKKLNQSVIESIRPN